MTSGLCFECAWMTFDFKINRVSYAKNILWIQFLLYSSQQSLVGLREDGVGEHFPDFADSVVVGDAAATLNDFVSGGPLDLVVDLEGVLDAGVVEAEVDVNSSALWMKILTVS